MSRVLRVGLAADFFPEHKSEVFNHCQTLTIQVVLSPSQVHGLPVCHEFDMAKNN